MHPLCLLLFFLFILHACVYVSCSHADIAISFLFLNTKQSRKVGVELSFLLFEKTHWRVTFFLASKKKTLLWKGMSSPVPEKKKTRTCDTDKTVLR